MRVVFFGTSKYALPSLKSLFEKHDVVAVITTPDKPAGRKKKLKPSPVKSFVLENQKDTLLLQPEKLRNNAELENHLKDLKADVFVVSAYGKIIPPSIYTIPPLKTLCLHPSLLPRHRGPTPIETALLNGDTETGNTVFLMEQKVDSGPILTQRKIKIEITDDYETLTEKLSIDGAKLLMETLELWKNGEIKPQEQNENEATSTHFFDTESARINWNASAMEVHNKVRAFRGNINAFSFFRGKRVLILKTIPANDIKASPGEVVKVGKALMVKCGKGAVEILLIQPAGKKPMSSLDFINGYKPQNGEKFGSI